MCLPGLPPFYDYEWYPYPEDVSGRVQIQVILCHSGRPLQAIKDLPATSFDVFNTGHK